MAKGIQESDQTITSRDVHEESTKTEDETYVYKDSGIRERHGYIPIWLQLVAYALFVWAIYYTIRYW